MHSSRWITRALRMGLLATSNIVAGQWLSVYSHVPISGSVNSAEQAATEKIRKLNGICSQELL